MMEILLTCIIGIVVGAIDVLPMIKMITAVLKSLLRSAGFSYI